MPSKPSPNAPKEIAQTLINAEPIMQIGNALGAMGDAILDAPRRLDAAVTRAKSVLLPGQTPPKRTRDIPLPPQRKKR